MYSSKSDYDYEQRRSHSSQGSRSWGEEDRREDWKEPQRNSIQDMYEISIGDGHNRSEGVSSSDYGEPYARDYISDTDWRKKHISLHGRSGTEKRRRTLEDDTQYRCQQETESSYRQSSEKFSQRNKDFNCTISDGEGYSHRRTPEEFRYSQNQEEFRYSQYKEDSHYRPTTEYYKDRDGRERSRSPVRMRSRDAFIKSYTPPRPKSDNFSRNQEDDNHTRSRFSLNGSSRLSESSHHHLSPPPLPPPPTTAAATAAGEKKMSKGFQRFLDVLNMGVNMETLTQIVTQGSPDVNVHQPYSQSQGDRPWTDEPSQRQEKTEFWPQTERSHQRLASPLSRSYSSNGKTESYLENRRFERKCPSPKINTPSSEEEHKRKQMHDVLQAIGMKLEFEELGQMSSRIQERLYGKKQTDSSPVTRKEEEEREKRRQYVPKRCSRSSSGSSSGSSFQDHKKNTHWEETDFRYQTDRHSAQKKSSNYPAKIISQTTYHRPNPEPPPVQMPPHIPPPSSIINYPPPPFANFPPNFPPGMSNMFMPQMPFFLPPYLQTPPVPPPNMFPPAAPSFPQLPNKAHRLRQRYPKRRRNLQEVQTKE